LQQIYGLQNQGRRIQAMQVDIWNRNDSKCIKFWTRKSICNRAKRLQPFGVAIDMPAGPSELLIVADDAVPAFVASDLLSQAEHGADSQVILVSTSKLIDAVAEIETYSNELCKEKPLPKP
jgi:hypothetical protein